MNVSNNSTQHQGIVLVESLWDEIGRLRTYIDRCTAQTANKSSLVVISRGTAEQIKQTMVHAVHRLSFLEMVTTGMSYMEQHDAQSYAKFVNTKRQLEDLDIAELRDLLR